ncbi:MAG: hypothetical protein MUD13_09775 [Candidatus Nanopelagicales bacterium]|nr:hypothetical protein [Candidatus Nanopelagicales bacterium]
MSDPPVPSHEDSSEAVASETLPSDAVPSDAVSPPPATGDPRVDDALSRLAEVEVLPRAEQVAVYTDIHRRLAAVLADPESRG